MMTKLEFIYLANCMLLDAVEAMAYDLGMYPHDELSEPAHTAAIVTKFPSLMNKHWGGAKFAGCYIHQSPRKRRDGFFAVQSGGAERLFHNSSLG